MLRQFDDVLLGSIELFCLAAEQGSFTAAATTAGVTPAAVSRTIARLEARLGARLFVRTTRQIRLTEGGEVYFHQCKQALVQLADAEREVSGQQALPAGLLRISMPTTYGHYRVLPLMPQFRARYPEIQLELNLSNRNVDLMDEGYDLAIRARELADSSLIARRIEDAPLVVVATPEYLARAGTPRSLEALATHECIQFTLPSNGRSIEWLFRRGQQDIDLATQGNYCCSDDVLGGVTLARHGAGLCQTFRYAVEDDLRSGRLVEVLTEFAGRSRRFSLIYSHRKYLPLRVRVFIEFLLDKLGDAQFVA
jgi:DNA-binding transcriptional LysR family regulator